MSVFSRATAATHALAAAFLMALFGAPALCGEPAPGKAPSPAAQASLFHPDRVIRVDVTLAAQDWDRLRNEGRGLATIWSGNPAPYDYTWFQAAVTIDGKRFENVGVRKKGYLGSLSALRPSLKIRFDKFEKGRTCAGLKNMTLNNDRQDPSHTHQSMCYALFRKAGCPAPLCHHARVTVNGKDLGVYSHVERIGKAFLERHFQDGSGNLYEGQGADFTAGLISKFERKTNRKVKGPDGKPDRSDLDLVVKALKARGDAWLAEIGKVVDIEAFLDFWAMELITGHWDGYTGDRNNFYLYNDPKTGRFHFIPWGTDGAFSENHAFLPGIPKSVYAWSQLAYRLYQHPATRQLYHDRLRDLLNDMWDEDALLAEVDRIERLVAPDPESLEEQRAFIRGRKAAILAEIEGGGPAWLVPPVEKRRVPREPIPVSGAFSTVWSEKEDFAPGAKLSLEIRLGGRKQSFAMLLNTAGRVEEDGEFQKDTAAVKFYAIRPGQKNLFVALTTLPDLFKKGELPFHGMETCGMVVEHDPATGKATLLGLIGNGSIVFTSAGTAPGDKVEGRFTGLFAYRPRKVALPAAEDSPVTVLCKAAASGDLETVKRLIREGADLNARDPAAGQTPLAWAVIFDRLDVVSLLLRSGADPQATSKGSNTPLHTAAFLGRDRCARSLLDAGAPAKARNERGEAPADLLRVDRATTELIASMLKVKIDFDEVTEGRQRIAGMLASGK